MGVDRDDEALSWAGEADPGPTATQKPARAGESAATGDAGAKSNSVLIVYGIFAGVYLLYAVGWGIHVFTHSVPVAGVFPVIMYQLGEFLAIASPFLWAGAVWLLTKKPVTRVLWLFIGVLLLAPWPFIVGG